LRRWRSEFYKRILNLFRKPAPGEVAIYTSLCIVKRLKTDLRIRRSVAEMEVSFFRRDKKRIGNHRTFILSACLPGGEIFARECNRLPGRIPVHVVVNLHIRVLPTPGQKSAVFPVDDVVVQEK